MELDIDQHLIHVQIKLIVTVTNLNMEILSNQKPKIPDSRELPKVRFDQKRTQIKYHY